MPKPVRIATIRPPGMLLWARGRGTVLPLTFHMRARRVWQGKSSRRAKRAGRLARTIMSDTRQLLWRLMGPDGPNRRPVVGRRPRTWAHVARFGPASGADLIRPDGMVRREYVTPSGLVMSAYVAPGISDASVMALALIAEIAYKQCASDGTL